MKYLLLCLLFTPLAFADTNGTTTSTSTLNSVANTNAPTFVTPMTMGGGDVLPTHNTLTMTSATCATNQFIVEGVNTNAGLRGSGAPKIGNYGNAFGMKLVIPFGDDGACLKRSKLINKSAELEYARNTHNLCLGSAQSFKNAEVFLDDEYYEAYPDMRVCRKIFVLTGISFKIQ